MRCDICGGEIQSGQEAFDTKSEQTNNVGPSIPTGGFWDAGKRNKTVLIMLCPACVRRRDRREVWLWIAVSALFVGIAFAVSQFPPTSPPLAIVSEQAAATLRSL
jgi:hypothetical protein